MNERKKAKSYTVEFKESAVRLAVESQLPPFRDPEAGQALCQRVYNPTSGSHGHRSRRISIEGIDRQSLDPVRITAIAGRELLRCAILLRWQAGADPPWFARSPGGSPPAHLVFGGALPAPPWPRAIIDDGSCVGMPPFAEFDTGEPGTIPMPQGRAVRTSIRPVRHHLPTRLTVAAWHAMRAGMSPCALATTL